MLKESEYMDKKRFPLTSQKTLTYSEQVMIDSFNYDEGVRWVQAGNELNKEQNGRRKELEIKLGRDFNKDILNPAYDR